MVAEQLLRVLVRNALTLDYLVLRTAYHLLESLDLTLAMLQHAYEGLGQRRLHLELIKDYSIQPVQHYSPTHPIPLTKAQSFYNQTHYSLILNYDINIILIVHNHVLKHQKTYIYPIKLE